MRGRYLFSFRGVVCPAVALLLAWPAGVRSSPPREKPGAIAFIAGTGTDQELDRVYAQAGLTCFARAALQVMECTAYGNYLKPVGLREMSSLKAEEMLGLYFMVVVPWVPDWSGPAAARLKNALISYVRLGGVLYLEGPVGEDRAWLDFFELEPVAPLSELAGCTGKQWCLQVKDVSGFPASGDYLFSYFMAWWSDDSDAQRDPWPRDILAPAPPRRGPPHVDVEGYPAYAGTAEPRDLSLIHAYESLRGHGQELSFAGRREGVEKIIQAGQSLFLARTPAGGAAAYQALPFLDLAGQLALSTASEGRGLFCWVLQGGCESWNGLLRNLFELAGLAVPQRHYLPNGVVWTYLPTFDTTSFPDTGTGEMFDERISEMGRILCEHDLQGVFLEGWGAEARPITAKEWPLMNRYRQLAGLYYSAARYGFDPQFIRQTVEDLRRASGQFPHLVRDSGKRFQGKRGSFWGREMLETVEKAWPDEYFIWCDEAYNGFSSTYPVPYLSFPGDDPHTYLLSVLGGSKDSYLRDPSAMDALIAVLDSCRARNVPATPHVHPAFITLEQVHNTFHTMVDRLVSTPGFKPVNLYRYLFYNVNSSKQISAGFSQTGENTLHFSFENCRGTGPVYGYTLFLPDRPVRSVSLGGEYLLAGGRSHVLLPVLAPGRAGEVTVELGEPDPALPVVDIRGGDIDLERAAYRAGERRIDLRFSGAGRVFVTVGRLPDRSFSVEVNGDRVFDTAGGPAQCPGWLSFSVWRQQVLTFELDDAAGREVEIVIEPLG
ncbi:MAG: hypothetical protein JXQ83_05655 [Candidatus Glassbacteria bacterium]|nr:hypothetical protein [Candidatus Glassbacteria bacterium]